MPPRSVNRKKSTAASARAKKLTPKSKHLHVESSLAADENTVIKLENEDKESESPEWAGTQQYDASATAADQVTADEEIRQEIEVSAVNSLEVEGLGSGDRYDVLASSVVEMKVEVEEMIEGLQNVESVMEDCEDMNTDNVIEGNGVTKEERETMDGVEIDGADTLNFVPNADNVAEEKGEVEGEENDGGEVSNNGSESSIDISEKSPVGEETVAAQVNNVEALPGNDKVHIVNEGCDGEAEGEESGDDADGSEEDNVMENEDDEELSMFCYEPLTKNKEEKAIELYVGRLDKRVVENDLIEIFGKFGEIKEVRVARNPTTNKSKGFAFLKYASIEQSRNALSALKDGVEVRGKHVKIAESQSNATLYVIYICKSWTYEHVSEALKGYGIEHIEELHLPDDPNKEGKIKGYAILEFSTHSNAMVAFHRLRQRDAVFGCDRSAKVAFAQTPTHPSEEVLLQIKTVYLEGLADTWNEEKVRETCEKYGEVVKVKFSGSLATTRKDFGFITFTSRESALACVEGINNAHIGEGEVKVKACIAKPQWKGRIPTKGFRGGFNLKKKSKKTSLRKESESAKQAGTPKMKGPEKSRQEKRKGKVVAEEKGNTLSAPKTIEGGKPNALQGVSEGHIVKAPSNKGGENEKKRKLPSKADARGKRGVEPNQSKRPSKKQRGNTQGRQGKNFREVKREPRVRKVSRHVANPVTHRNSYIRGNAASATNYPGQTHNSISVSKRRHTDMEPHAGYLEPVATKQGRSYAGYPEMQGQTRVVYLQPDVRTQGQPHTVYIQPTVGTQVRAHAGYVRPSVGTQVQHHLAYVESAAGTQGRSYTGYPEYTVQRQVQSHSGYPEPAIGTQSLAHVGYYEPAAGPRVHDPYDHGLRRAAGHEGQSSSSYAYVGGSAHLPSYPPSYASYAGYEYAGAAGGYYQSGATYLPPGAHY